MKTRFERLETINPEIAGFRVEGKLGFHENEKMERLVDECLKRGFSEVIFDFSGLSSLGGGVARILRSFIATMDEQGKIVKFVITNNIVLDFLRDEGAVIHHYKTMDEAYRSVVAPVMKARDGSPREAAREEASACAVDRASGRRRPSRRSGRRRCPGRRTFAGGWRRRDIDALGRRNAPVRRVGGAAGAGNGAGNGIGDTFGGSGRAGSRRYRGDRRDGKRDNLRDIRARRQRNRTGGRKRRSPRRPSFRASSQRTRTSLTKS